MSASGASKNLPERVLSIVPRKLTSHIPLPGVPGSSVIIGGPPWALADDTRPARKIESTTAISNTVCFLKVLFINVFSNRKFLTRRRELDLLLIAAPALRVLVVSSRTDTLPRGLTRERVNTPGSFSRQRR